MVPEKAAQKIIEWMQEIVAQAGAKGVVLGISGGIDSAVAAVLAKRAFPDDCLGVMMPCGNMQEDEVHSRLLLDKFQIAHTRVDLQDTFRQMTDRLLPNVESGTASETAARSNIKPRLRMIVLYYLAQARNYLVIGTSNKSERTVGYFTKHGDGGADLLPLGDLTKREIYQLAAYLDIPQEICRKAPSAGLWEGQTDEAEMGFTYQQLDAYLEQGTTDAAALEKIQRMERNSAHKRALPPIAEIDRED